MADEKMSVSTLFIQRKEPYTGAYGPEVLVAWDEFSKRDNEEGFSKEVAEKLHEIGDELESYAIVDIKVSLNSVMALLRPTGTVDGDIP